MKINTKQLKQILQNHFNLVTGEVLDEKFLSYSTSILNSTNKPIFLKNKFQDITYLFIKETRFNQIYAFPVFQEITQDAFDNPITISYVQIGTEKLMIGHTLDIIPFDAFKKYFETILFSKQLPDHSLFQKGFTKEQNFSEIFDTADYSILSDQNYDGKLVLFLKAPKIGIPLAQKEDRLYAFYNFSEEYNFEIQIGNSDFELNSNFLETIESKIKEIEEYFNNIENFINKEYMDRKTQINTTMEEEIDLVSKEAETLTSLPGLKGL